MSDEAIAKKIADRIYIDADFAHEDRRKHKASSYPPISLPGQCKQFHKDLVQLRQHFKESKGILERPQLAAIKEDLDHKEKRWAQIKASKDPEAFDSVQRDYLWKCRKILSSEIAKHLQSFDAMWQPYESRHRGVIEKKMALKELVGPVPECVIPFARKVEIPMSEDNRTTRDCLVRLAQIISSCLNEPFDQERLRPQSWSPQTSKLLSKKPVTVFKRKKKGVAADAQAQEG